MKKIEAKEVQEKLEAGEKLNLLDVREVFEVKEERIPGTIHIPLDLLEARMPELNKKEPYVVLCLSGGRSGIAVQFLSSHGFDVTNMTGGMLAWTGELE